MLADKPFWLRLLVVCLLCIGIAVVLGLLIEALT